MSNCSKFGVILRKGGEQVLPGLHFLLSLGFDKFETLYLDAGKKYEKFGLRFYV